MTYQEVVALDATIPEVLDFGDDTKNKAIRDMVMDMYWNWEIAGETIGEFRGMLAHSFGVIKDYYNEIIDAYQTKINMLDGRKTVTKIDSTNKNEENYTNKFENTSKTTGDGGSTDKIYDLPRSTTSENRPSGLTENRHDSASDNTASGTTTSNGGKTSTKDDTITITGGENVIQLKKEYLKLIKNIYKECANNLQKCFLDIFW